MGDVIDLHQRRIEKLAGDLARRLRRSDGRVTESVRDLPVSVDTWRAAARRAGRLLGWSIRTRVHDGQVSLVDNRTNQQRPRGRGGSTADAARRSRRSRRLELGDPDK